MTDFGHCEISHGNLYPFVKCVFAGRIPKATSWHGSRCDPRAPRQFAILSFDSVFADAHFGLILGLAFLSCFPVMFFMLGSVRILLNCGLQLP